MAWWESGCDSAAKRRARDAKRKQDERKALGSTTLGCAEVLNGDWDCPPRLQHTTTTSSRQRRLYEPQELDPARASLG